VANLSDALEASILQNFLTSTAVASQTITAKPTTWCIGLHTAGDTSAETNANWTATELLTTGAGVGSNYTRIPTTFAITTTGGINIVGNTVSASWTSWGLSTYNPTITHIAIWDSVTVNGGNMLFWVDTNNITPSQTDVITINTGQITLTMQ